MNFFKRQVEKYRQEAYDLYVGTYTKDVTWRAAILEAIFRPMTVVKGKEPMSHLHPDIDKLHLPEGIYIADWRKYRVEDHPALVNFQKKCHAAGLHDPWLRNFAHSMYPNQMSHRSRFAFITQGFLFGLCAGTAVYWFKELILHFRPVHHEHSPEYLAKHGDKPAHH